MPTITWGGSGGYVGYTVTFNHPSALKNWGYPEPPRQPIASWPTELAQFQAACSSATEASYEGIMAQLHASYMYATIADVPGPALAAFQKWVRWKFGSVTSPNSQNGGLPPYLSESAGSWR